MKWYGIFRRFFSKADSAPRPVATKSDGPPIFDVRDRYREPVYLDLTERCAMGDIVAMLELAQWHRQWAPPEGEKLLAAYEQDPQTCDDLEAWFHKNRYGSADFHIRCYITWVCRAALYGNSEAEALAERCPRFKSWGLLPERLYGLGTPARYRSSQHFYSFELHRLGLRDIDEKLEEFSLYPLTEDGIFPGYYLADYIPADSDGFGREDDYEDIYYDEFFNRLYASNLPAARAKAECLAQKRRAYWEDPAHDRDHRMYKRLLSHKK